MLITGSDYLKDEVARIAAAAAVPLTMLPRLQDAHLADGRILLVGSDQAAAGVRPGPVILMGTAEDGERLWELAARMGAERVAVLPEAAGWLAEHLSRSASRSVRGSVVGMVGGAGGAGTSTLSCWLAHAAGELGHPGCWSTVIPGAADWSWPSGLNRSRGCGGRTWVHFPPWTASRCCPGLRRRKRRRKDCPPSRAPQPGQ